MPVASFPPIDYPRGRYTYQSECQLVEVMLDRMAFDFYVDAHEDADPNLLDEVLTIIALTHSVELIDEDESEPEPLGGGWLRIYLAPIVASPDLVLEPDMAPLDERELPAEGSVRESRTFHGLTTAAVFTTALAVAGHVAPIMEVIS